MEMRKTLIVLFLSLCTVLLTQSLWKEKANEMKPDESVIMVLAKLSCPYELSEIDSGVANDYEVLSSIDIPLKKMWNTEEGRVELYQGNSGGYLALLVKDEKILCAQYINGSKLNDSYEYRLIPANSYFHENVFSGDGMYIKGQSAFYIDGRAIYLLYTTPQDKEPICCYVNDENSILSLIEHFPNDTHLSLHGITMDTRNDPA